jgi:hypothetical protein
MAAPEERTGQLAHQRPRVGRHAGGPPEVRTRAAGAADRHLDARLDGGVRGLGSVELVGRRERERRGLGRGGLGGLAENDGLPEALDGLVAQVAVDDLLHGRQLPRLEEDSRPPDLRERRGEQQNGATG